VGWTLDLTRIGRSEVDCDHLGDPELSVYRFRRFDSEGEPENLTVLNAFILPDGRTSADVFDRDPFDAPPTRAARGLAQLQLVFRSDVPETEAIEVAREILSEFPREVMRALIGTPQGGTP
jgi:hypothetical protein